MLKQGNCVKRITAVTTGALEAHAGESFLIKGLYVKPNTNNTYLILKVDRKTVGVYRIYGKSGNHLDHIQGGTIHRNLMEFLIGKEINCTIPVAEGQSFSLSAVGTSPVVVIVYDTYDAADIRADMPNGTDGKEYLFMQYMSSSETVDAAKTVTLDTSLSPAEFPDFPCGKSVPANATIDILGLVGCPVGNGTMSTFKTGSQYVKLVKERETLFDEDYNGIPFFSKVDEEGGIAWNADFSLIGPGVSLTTLSVSMGSDNAGTLGDPLIFVPELRFTSGEELLVYMKFLWTTAYNLAGSNIDLAAIMKVTMG